MVHTDILSIEVQMSDEGRTIVDDVGDLCPNTTSPFSSATATTSNWYSVELIKLSIFTDALEFEELTDCSAVTISLFPV